MTPPTVSTVAVVTLWPGSKTGHVRTDDLTPSTFAGLGWDDHTPPQARLVIVDLTRVTGFGGGVAERVALALLEAGAGPVRVQGGRSSVREAFAQRLTDSIQQNCRGGR